MQLEKPCLVTYQNAVAQNRLVEAWIGVSWVVFCCTCSWPGTQLFGDLSALVCPRWFIAVVGTTCWSSTKAVDCSTSDLLYVTLLAELGDRTFQAYKVGIYRLLKAQAWKLQHVTVLHSVKASHKTSLIEEESKGLLVDVRPNKAMEPRASCRNG